MDKPFYTLTLDGTTYAFRKPDIAQIDRLTSRMARAPLSAALDFTRELAVDLEAWNRLVAEKPGTALTATNGILEALGFQAA